MGNDVEFKTVSRGNGSSADGDRRPLIVGLGGTLRPESRSYWALEEALRAAERAGAATRTLALRDLDLPLFRPGKPLEAYPAAVTQLVEAAGAADGMIWSTGAYHGTLAGATKNALDFMEFLSEDGYLDGIPVGLIATSGGEIAAVNAIDAMIHVVHACRGTALPLKVPITRSLRAIDGQGHVRDAKARARLAKLGEMTVAAAAQRETVTRQAA